MGKLIDVLLQLLIVNKSNTKTIKKKKSNNAMGQGCIPELNFHSQGVEVITLYFPFTNTYCLKTDFLDHGS